MTEMKPSIDWAEEIARYRAYIGRRQLTFSFVDQERLHVFGAAIGDVFDERDSAVPALWHWSYFNSRQMVSDIGPDGHPQRGAFLPPVRLKRRMFAGANLEFVGPLRVGREAHQSIEIIDVKYRLGKGGDLVFVGLSVETVQDGRVCIREHRTIAFTTEKAAGSGIDARTAPATKVIQKWVPSTIDLFRFSAITLNTHRIHYDCAYASTVEGYPGLVVQGPLIAAKLCTLAKHGTLLPIRSFKFRATGPNFVDRELGLFYDSTDPCANLLAVNRDGEVTMQAHASF